MDMWKFFDITHREHIVCNPMSLEKLEQLITLLSLNPVARVSPYCIADVRKKQQERVPDAQLHFLEMDGAGGAMGT